MKPAVIAAVTNALVAMPSMAGEPGKIFDFNLTLPIIATEFLLLMVILDKTIFGPVGKALDDRDASRGAPLMPGAAGASLGAVFIAQKLASPLRGNTANTEAAASDLPRTATSCTIDASSHPAEGNPVQEEDATGSDNTIRRKYTYRVTVEKGSSVGCGPR